MGGTPKTPLRFSRDSSASPFLPVPRRIPRVCGPLHGGTKGWGSGCRTDAAPGQPQLGGRRGTPGPASSGYLVVVQPRLQDLIQLPRQRVAGLRRDPACPIAEAVGSPGRGYCHYLPAALGHSVAGPAPSSVAATSALGWDARQLRDYCACARSAAHAPRVAEGSVRTA